jgi:hypothetical protein
MLTGELRRKPEFEDLWLILKSLVILFVVGGCETRYVYAPAFMVLANALGEKFSAFGDLEDVIGILVFTLLFVTQAAPEERVSISVNGEM